MTMPAAAAIALLVFAGWFSGATPVQAAATRPALLVPEVELIQLAPVDQRYDEADDARRAAMLSRRLRTALATWNHYVLLEDQHAPYRYTDCKACVLDWARSRDAGWLLLVSVQKESRLILSVNLALVDLRNGTERSGSVELRGDTDDTWIAGTQQLLDRYLGMETPL